MRSISLSKLALALGIFAVQAFAHLAAFTDGMYCPELKYKGPLTNFTDTSLVVFDPLYNLTKDAWFLSKGRNCLLAEPTGVWEIPANSEISVPWANWQNSTGYYADGKNLTDRPIPYSVTNPQVAAEGLISDSHGLASPNMHAANKTTAAGTAIAVAYVDNVYAVTMENLIVVSTAPETPFERLANYTIPDLAPCDACICVTGWIPDGYGLQNMYMAAHKCKITNTGPGKKPVTPGQIPGPNVGGAKQMIAAFQYEGNTVFWKQGVNKTVPTYSPRMGYMQGAQTDIFGDESGESSNSSSSYESSASSSSSVSSSPSAAAGYAVSSTSDYNIYTTQLPQASSTIQSSVSMTSSQAMVTKTRTADTATSTATSGDDDTCDHDME